MKLFAFASALTLITAGVFAAKVRFANTGLYVYKTGTGYLELVSGSLGDLQITGTTPSKITDQGSVSYEAYTNTGTNTYTPVYSTTAW